MNIPIFSFRSSRDPEDSIGRINRALDDRNHRLSAGLSVSDRFDRVHGAIIVTQGNGRYLRVRHVVDASVDIPKAIGEGCLEFVNQKNRDVGQLAQLLMDLAETQSTVIEQLKCSAGKYVDRVLAVAVCDPGYWESDFDGRVSYTPMCDATRLAELCGVSVVDAFPARDLTVGGNGKGLESLPLWMIFADRNEKLAEQKRMLFRFSRHCTGYVFPASDGLDADVPAIHSFDDVGLGFLDMLLEQAQPEFKTADIVRLYSEGRHVDSLMKCWETAVGNSMDQPSEPAANLTSSSKVTKDLVNQLVQISQSYLEQHVEALPDVAHTAFSWTVRLTMDRIRTTCPEGLDQVYVSSDARYQSTLIELLNRSLAEGPGFISPSQHNSKSRQTSTLVLPAEQQGVSSGQIASVVAAMLGLFHIDQMPANVPWLTGANGQRILGRLTPGRPANWRQLLRVMADFHPAPMKLKDAI